MKKKELFVKLDVVKDMFISFVSALRRLKEKHREILQDIEEYEKKLSEYEKEGNLEEFYEVVCLYMIFINSFKTGLEEFKQIIDETKKMKEDILAMPFPDDKPVLEIIVMLFERGVVYNSGKVIDMFNDLAVEYKNMIIINEE